MLAPVVLFVYNRSEQLQQVLNCLNDNAMASDTDLYIFSDGPKREKDIEKVEKVRIILEKFRVDNHFKSVTVYASQENRGLARSVINGVSEIVSKYGKVIVLEDDLIVAKDFLQFMNQGLEFYRDDERVGAISGYSLPIKLKKTSADKSVYKSRTGNSWGWATWVDIWNKVDWGDTWYDSFLNDTKRQKEFDKVQYGISNMLKEQIAGKIDSWAVRWDYHFFMNGLCTIYPPKSKIQNVGFGQDGTHTHNENDEKKDVLAKEGNVQFIEYDQLVDMTVETAKSFKMPFWKKVIEWLKSKGGI